MKYITDIYLCASKSQCKCLEIPEIPDKLLVQW